MAMDFSGSAGAASSFDTVPAGLLVFAILNVKGVKASASGGGYLDCELTIVAGQPHAGRKIFEMIGDPQNPANSEKYREMGTIAITRILEAGRGAGPNNPGGYVIEQYSQLSGLRVAIKTGVELGTGGHPDKNRVAEWLTPNPASQSGNKGWVRLAAGDHGGTAPAAAAQTGFGGFGAAATLNPAQGGGFGSAPATGGFAQSGAGFQQPAGNAPAQSAAPLQTSSGFAAGPPATTQFPSNPGDTPGWLAQAGGN